MTSRRILVVDDEESVRWALSKALERAGYRVDLAADGPSAVSYTHLTLPTTPYV